LEDYVLLLQMFRECREGIEYVKEHGDKISAVVGTSVDSHRWKYYDLAFEQHSMIAGNFLGLKDAIDSAQRSSDPNRALTDLARAEFHGEGPAPPDPSPEDFASAVGSAVSLLRSLESVSIFGRSLNSLLQRAEEGDTKALRHAVSIDRTVTLSESGKAAVSHLTVTEGEAALDKLLAIRKPDERLKQYAELRFIHWLLKEAGALDGAVPDSVIHLVTETLALYSTVGGDAAKNIRQLFRKFDQEGSI
jgi:hypothetical protein